MAIRIKSSSTGSAEDSSRTLPLIYLREPGSSSHELASTTFALPPALTARLAFMAEHENISLPSIYLAAFVILLSSYGGAKEIEIGLWSSELRSPIPRPKCERVLRLDCSSISTARAFLCAVAGVVQNVEGSSQNGFGQSSVAAHRPGFYWSNDQDGLSGLDGNSGGAHGLELLLAIQSSGNSIQPAMVYRSDLFEAETMNMLTRAWLHLLTEMAADPNRDLSDVAILPADERISVLELFSGSGANYPQLCIHELFAEQACLHPNAEAVVFGTERLTYSELDRRSNQMANFLMSEGIQPDDRVGIFMDRSTDMIVAMLGILKASATYVPIDIDYPAERLGFVADDTNLRLVLTQKNVEANFPPRAALISVDAPGSRVKLFGYEPLTNRSTPESIALVNYTSGSTGQPKAACIPHRAVVRTVRNTNYIEIVPEVDRVAQAGSPSFDAAIMEIWLALANGATVVGVRRETLLSMNDLPRMLRAEKINILVLNTSYVHQIGRDAPEALRGVRKVLFGGEAAEPAPLRRILHHVGPGVLVNSYGPAEGCVITSYHEITDIPEHAVTIPIGRPVTNAQVYLLDSQLQPVALGVTGEIYIGGEGVARGYLNRPELTAQRFVPDVFSGRPDRALYRTGDFARMGADGQLEFIGRNDEQVKIRGHRIELAEVRQAISSHPAVKQLFLMVREDVEGDRRLVAYVTLHDQSQMAQELLRQHAVAKLPSEMVPAAFVVLDLIPLNTNGKIDRKALPPPFERPQSAAGYQAPGRDFECKLTQIWQQLLRLDHIGVNDNFFDLGGHSLLAARLIARIEKQMGINIPMATLFEAPTVAQLAARLEQRSFESSWSPLVELHVPNKARAANPFFCVHSLGANLVSFHKLAALMRGNRPIYGLQPHGLDGRDRPFDTIESMASAYLQEIRKKQPQGPYFLGGICLGGVIAYEIAQQLRANGETVAVLALMDSYAPGVTTYLRSRSPISEHIDRHLGDMMLLPTWGIIKHLAQWLANGAVRFGRSIGLREHSSLADATRKVAMAHRRAFFSYKPKPYAGRIIQLMCGDASHRSYEDRRLAWSSLAMTGFEVRLVPGDHHSMVEEPNAQVLAHELQQCLDRAAGVTSMSENPFGREHSFKITPAHLDETRVTAIAS